MVNREYINEHLKNIEKSQKVIEQYNYYVRMALTLTDHSIQAIKKELEKENTENGSKK